MKFDLRVSGVNEVKKSMNKYTREVTKALQKEIDSTAMNIHGEARRNAPSDQGILRARLQFTKGKLASIVWSGAKYSLDVEKGQGPDRWPNKDDLMGWVKRQIRPAPNELKAVTYAVGEKIYMQGTKAQPFFEPAVKKYKQRYFNNVTRIIKNSKL